MLGRCMMADPHVVWEDALEWGIKELKGRSLGVNLCKLAFVAVVYHLWKKKE